MPHESERTKALLIGALLTILLLVVGIRFAPDIEHLNNTLIDFQVELLPEAALSPLPVIVKVDEKSLAAYGQWPWPRYQVARLLQAIQQAGASAVAVDALFVEVDRSSLREIQHVLARDFNQKLPLEGVDESLWDFDKILGQTLHAGPFILSYFFSFDTAEPNHCQPQSASGVLFSAYGDRSLNGTPATNAVCNLAVLQQAANYSGFINAAPDNDGIYRQTPLVIQYQERLYPSLALQAYLTSQSIDRFVVSASHTGFTLQAGKLQVPLDESGNLRIKFPRSGQHFNEISAFDVLSGKLADRQLQGKIVSVGFSATGLQEFRPTPYDPKFLGVQFHASILDNLYRQDFLYRPNSAQMYELLTASLLGLVLFAALANAKPITILTIPSLILLAMFAASQWLLMQTGIAISPALPAIMTSMTLLTLSLIKYVHEYLRAEEMALMIAHAQEGLIQSFSSMSEFRDPETGAHIRRTQNYVKALAEQLQKHPKFSGILSNDVVELMFKAAPLHDVGKVGIRDNILLKPAELADPEFEIMKSHSKIGAKIIEAVTKQSGWSPFMHIAHEICLSHHEKWDGSGYPQGLAGEAIPLSARLMAIADVYDALTSKRVYKPGFSHAKAMSIIQKGKGSHFDPLLVETFETIHQRFLEIALHFSDDENHRTTLQGSGLVT